MRFDRLSYQVTFGAYCSRRAVHASARHKRYPQWYALSAFHAEHRLQQDVAGLNDDRAMYALAYAHM